MVRVIARALGRGITKYETAEAEFLVINFGNVGYAVSHIFRLSFDDLPFEFIETFPTRLEAMQYVERHA
jgi:hypothetical protein